MSRMRSCSIKDCKSKGDKIVLHNVPTSIKRLEKWKKALKQFLDDKLDETTLICTKHFSKSDYIPSLTGPKTLCKTAVPSIFPKSTPQTSMPKKQPEVVVRPRHQSRRAASKEALKQMQMLLEDEDDAVEIPDDDDVIPVPVVVSPPKKKYKLTHRKSSDGNDREVLVLKSITPNITNHYVENNLELECWVEELEPCQKDRNKKLEEEEKQLQSKLDELIKACKGEIVYKGDLTTVIEVSEHVQKTIQAVQASVNKPPIVLNSAVANPQPGYQLVMDPRLGLIVGTVQPSNQTPKKQQGKIQVASNLQAPVTPVTPVTPANQGTPASNSRRSRTKKQTPVVQPIPSPPTPVTTRSVPSTRSAPVPATRSTPVPATRSTPVPATRSTPVPATRSTPTTRSVVNTTKQSNKRTAPQPPPAAPPATRSRRDPAAAVATARPTETSVEGGLTTGTNAKPKAVVDLTSDDGKPLPDSREISFNKLQGKTFPSLVVVARPHLRVADINSDRAKLDAKVKTVLMYAPTKFTEWLIQQGLVKSDQKCSVHSGSKLKLGMYSDVSKFPYSGGYVWISECCPQRFVSVFSGSVFEGSPHPPLVILKILYHWCCQTNIQNVTQWVKVDNLYVKGMYTWLRAVCTVALQSHTRQLGGPQSKVEVGVISLGTTSQDGNSRQVKVEVLGILETSTKLIRLRAIEPLADGDRNYKKRFSKILEPLAQWVNPSSIIVTDLTVDKATLHQMGFSTVMQTVGDSTNSNRTIMEYLRRIVPRMFQNTLSLLSRQIIQQFLDELVWREWFGTTSMQAFDNLIPHLAEQTRTESSQSLIVKLNRVAQNPFKNWGIPTTSTTITTTIPAPTPSPTVKAADTTATKKRKRKEPEPPKPASSPAPEINRPPKSTSPDVPEQMVPLENYYYGTIDNYPPKTNVTLNMKCPFCKETFDNNIVLMNHLFKHAHNVSQDGQMCRYCLTSVPTANDLLKHIATAHPAETKHDNGFVCLICETQYMNPFVLGKHMSKEHCPSELPYQCGTCGYRCSNHKQAIDHFYKQHDNGPTIQCPFCLKSTTVFSSSRNIAQNMHYFIQHLQKHQRKQFARRCGKCNLWFVQKDVLKEHQTKMHASQRGKTGLIPWTAPRNGVMVPKSKMDKYPCDAEGINFSTLFFNVSKNLKCKECNGSMDSPKHFPSFESCQNPNCQYSTCCSNAMQEHNAKCSKNSQPPVPEEKLPYEMFCICGYSSGDGNQMARHLAVCERKSAYPSLSDAKSASVTHSMLDVLGLVRKPEETDKKQTAITRNIRRTTPKSEPVTITLDEDEPTETKILPVAPKKIKKDYLKVELKVKRDPKDSTSSIKTDESQDIVTENPPTLKTKEESQSKKQRSKNMKDSSEIGSGKSKIGKRTDSKEKDSTFAQEKTMDSDKGVDINETLKEVSDTDKSTEIIDSAADTDKIGRVEKSSLIKPSVAEVESNQKDSEIVSLDQNQAKEKLKCEETPSEEARNEQFKNLEKMHIDDTELNLGNQDVDTSKAGETSTEKAGGDSPDKKKGNIDTLLEESVDMAECTKSSAKTNIEQNEEAEKEEPGSKSPQEINIGDDEEPEKEESESKSPEEINVGHDDELEKEDSESKSPEEINIGPDDEPEKEDSGSQSPEESNTGHDEIPEKKESESKSPEESNVEHDEEAGKERLESSAVDQVNSPIRIGETEIIDQPPHFEESGKSLQDQAEASAHENPTVTIDSEETINSEVAEQATSASQIIEGEIDSEKTEGMDIDQSANENITEKANIVDDDDDDKSENVSQLTTEILEGQKESSTLDVHDDSANAPKLIEDLESAASLNELDKPSNAEVEQLNYPENNPNSIEYEDVSNTGVDSLTPMDTD